MSDLIKLIDDAIDWEEMLGFGTGDAANILRKCKAEIELLSSVNESLRNTNTHLDEKLAEYSESAVGEPVAWIIQSETGNGLVLTDLLQYRPSDELVEECGKYKKWCSLKPLYTATPSVDALIAEAIKKHDDEMAIAKTVNTRKLAQPYLDAMIAELDDWRISEKLGNSLGGILDKYRSAK